MVDEGVSVAIRRVISHARSTRSTVVEGEERSISDLELLVLHIFADCSDDAGTLVLVLSAGVSRRNSRRTYTKHGGKITERQKALLQYDIRVA